MDEKDKKHFEDLITKAVQSGKQETSGLVDLVIHKIEPAIKDSMDKNFNGKMGRFDQKLSDHINSFNEFKVEIKTILADKDLRVTSLEKGKIQIWTAISMLLVFGSVIITLSIMAIDSKIEKGFKSKEVQDLIYKSVEQTLLDNVNKIEYEK